MNRPDSGPSRPRSEGGTILRFLVTVAIVAMFLILIANGICPVP